MSRRKVVATASRVLAAFLAAVLVLLGAPSAPQERPSTSANPGTIATAEWWPNAVTGPANDSRAIASALARWGGEQRVLPRDLLDGYLPAAVPPPVPRAAGWCPPPVCDPGPAAASHAALPPGRAPPLTTLG